MMLQTRQNFWRPLIYNTAPSVANAVSPMLGQTGVAYSLDQTKPIEEIGIGVTFQVVGGALTLTGLDNILGIIKKIKVDRPSGVQSPAGTKVVDYRGIGLLEICTNLGLNLDAGTLGAIILNQGATIAANQWVRINYRVPLVHPRVGEPIRERQCLPVHTFADPCILTLDFEQAANMYTTATAGVITNMTVEVKLLRRQPNAAHTAAVLAAGGYMPVDLIEAPFAVATGIGTEQRISVPAAGKYLCHQFCFYQGGAGVTRGLPDAVLTVGSETKWQLQIGGTPRDEFLMNHLSINNDYSRPRNSQLQATSPASGLPVAAGTSYPIPASVLKDYLTDGIGGGQQAANEFGGVLDGDAAKAASNLIEFVFTPANVATNGHTIYVGGFRVWGDLTPYQVITA